MSMKSLFGKNLFGFKKPEKSEYLYDFAQHGLLSAYAPRYYDEFIEINSEADLLKSKSKKKKIEKPSALPKDLYDMKRLHDDKFQLNVDPDYIDDQVQQLKDKLDLLGKKPKPKKSEKYDFGEPGAKKYAREEVESILERLENRRKLQAFATIVNKYPHTTSDKINEVVQAHSNLECDKIDGFLPDFPKDAINAMKEYNKMCKDICGKETIFYLLLEKKNQATKNARRDPILFAQSPFGFFWQILGAWDKEMIYLADL